MEGSIAVTEKDTRAPEAGDCIGPYEVVELVEDFWSPGETALFLRRRDGDAEGHEWVIGE